MHRIEQSNWISGDIVDQYLHLIENSYDVITIHHNFILSITDTKKATPIATPGEYDNIRKVCQSQLR